MPKARKITPALPPRQELDRIIRGALREDLGSGDVTSRSALPPGQQGAARIVAREPGTFAGGPVVERVFHLVDPGCKVEVLQEEGRRFPAGRTLVRVRGKVRSLLSAERTALNFLQHLCGIATHTASIVGAIKGTRARVLATRKTLPGLRSLQKYAVCTGGGLPHRQGLYDEVLLKDNHFDLLAEDPAAVVEKVRKRVGPKKTITAEARNISEGKQLIRGGAGRILLDNMTPSQLRAAVRSLREFSGKLGRTVELEASGGIGAHNAKSMAASGVDRLSIGELTHSVRAINLAMEIDFQGKS